MWRTDHRLYPYQESASSRMALHDALLAFEMGCGKTPTTLHAIETLREKGDLTLTGTVVVPSSLKFQWESEIRKFTDQPVVVIDGPPAKRRKQYEQVREMEGGYMVISYDSLVRDKKLARVAHGFLVIDEATAIKNYSTARTKYLKEISPYYGMRAALTGTPIENGKLEELYSIMEFVDPDSVGPFWRFRQDHLVMGGPTGQWIQGYKNVRKFHNRIRPYMIRATHEEPEVARYLPKVQHMPPMMISPDRTMVSMLGWIEDQLLDDLSNMAHRLSDPDLRFLDEDDFRDEVDGRMMAKIQAMRMLLDDVLSITRSDGGFMEQMREQNEVEFPSNASNRKQVAVVNYVNDFLTYDPANKVVIFCSFVEPARELVRILNHSTGAVLFHGGMSPKQRNEAKKTFVSDPGVRVFISTDAGGYGLDLPQANLLINYDLPWSSGLLKQRNARIKRASSKWERVIVQDFIVEGTIEERMLQLLDHKSAVADAAVDGVGITESGEVDSDVSTLRAFLEDLRRKRL